MYLFIFAVAGSLLLPFKDSFPYRETILEPYGLSVLYSWANFDGVHYLGIAENGYFAEFTQAFFPLYPMLMKIFNFSIGNFLVSGLLISHVSLCIALWFLLKLIKLDFSDHVAVQTLIFLLLFPTSFYFGAVYNESLFLMVTVLSFYCMRTKRQNWAIVFGALASATRIIGIFLLPALLYEKYQQLHAKSPKQATNIVEYLPLLGVALGLLSYMLFLQLQYGDALYFVHAQPAFGAQRSADKLILLYQVIYRYLKMIVTVDWSSVLFYTVLQEFISSMVFLGLTIFSFIKVRRSYAIFALLSFILPTLTGTFSSMPRYVLLLFPAFIVLGQIKNKRIVYGLYAISAILLALNVLLFTRGYWIA